YPPLRTFTSSSARPQSQPPPSSPPPNYYDLFRTTFPSGAPPSSPFTTDVRQLRREFLQLQARAHPDLHSGADKSRAEATSAYINEAYKTLREPLLRAQYLLRLRGVEVANDETAKVGDDDAELLMRVLELREGVEAAESEEEVEAMRGENEERIRESERVLAGCFAEEGRLEEARREAVRLRYWVNVRESLDAWEKGK
ncbi:Co-chaperone Hsc20, partial [Viridothelium virens]